MFDFKKYDFEKSDIGDVTQKQLRKIMRELDFSPMEIDVNRRYHGKLFLSADVVLAWARGFESDAKVCKTTGELLESQITREVKQLKDDALAVLDKAENMFKGWQDDPVQRDALHSVIEAVMIHVVVKDADLRRSERSD